MFEKGGILIKLHISAVAHQPYSENDSFTDEPIGSIYCVPKYDTENLQVSTFKWVHGGWYFQNKGQEPDSTLYFKPIETERAKNTTSINFKQSITVPYIFGEQKMIEFGLYQTDVGGDSKPFCSVKTTVDEIMFAPDQIWKDKELRSETGNYCGDITVRAELEREPTSSISFAFRWNNVNNWSKGFMRTGMKAKRKRVAFTIERKDNEGKYVPISGIGIFKQESPNFGQETSELFRQRFLLDQF